MLFRDWGLPSWAAQYLFLMATGQSWMEIFSKPLRAFHVSFVSSRMT